MDCTAVGSNRTDHKTIPLLQDQKVDVWEQQINVMQ